MAGHARYTAVLDACVLYSIAITDALLSLATAGLYAAKWTTRIEVEWIRGRTTVIAIGDRSTSLASQLGSCDTAEWYHEPRQVWVTGQTSGGEAV